MSRLRPRRVADLLRSILAELLVRDVEDPRLQGAYLTEVRLTPDLRSATVYYSVSSGQEQERREAGLALGRARGFLRRELGRRLHLRVTPELRFRPDLSAERAAHIDDVLREIHDAEGGLRDSRDDEE